MIAMDRRRLMMGGSSALEEKRKYFAKMKVGDILLNDLTFVTPDNYTSGVTGVCCVPASATPDGWPRISGIRFLNSNGRNDGTNFSEMYFITPNNTTKSYQLQLYNVYTGEKTYQNKMPYPLYSYQGYINATYEEMLNMEITEDNTGLLSELNNYKQAYPYHLHYSDIIKEKLFSGVNRFTGSENTDRLIEVCGNYAVAASACRKYVTTKFQAGDWYLPTFAELVAWNTAHSLASHPFETVGATIDSGLRRYYIGSDLITDIPDGYYYYPAGIAGSWSQCSRHDSGTKTHVIPFFDLKKVCERIYG